MKGFWEDFFISTLFICKNKKEMIRKDEKKMRKGIVGVESVNTKKFRR